ncbi:hypothetical protein PEBR_27422 [Penicillium brasilianum]|uniref:Uncharacterized protein n=1 Tax=Penicillium brasilianum TaxID=104259 RepID=A0A1S9RUW9_PENBI|nr:hypothetical protein PEBR_27422 [Penicillium brasilianum]
MSLSSPASSVSPRHLVLRPQGEQQPGANEGSFSDAHRRKLPPLEVGQEQLFSFFRPSLPAGKYNVTTAQKINTKDGKQNLEKKSQQTFTVVTPQYALSDGTIKSVHPPPGYSAPVEALPHIVFNDPYLPWERTASEVIEHSNLFQVPWLAILVFTEDELRIAPDHSAGDNSIFREIPELMACKPDGNLSIPIPLEKVNRLKNCETPIGIIEASGESTEDSAQTIFLKPKLFEALFRGSDRPDLTPYGHLAHIRRVNTAGMANAGVFSEAYFSVVLSHRIGSLNHSSPTSVFAHLVSLEGIEDMKWPLQDSTQYVALASLHSWTYTCLPPGTRNLKDMMRYLGNTRDLLRARPSVPDSELSSDQRYVIARMNEGYSLARYLVQTGEETTAIFRGVLTPTYVPRPISKDWTMVSDCGLDLQILDRRLGIPDITYYAAWQLGKVTAIADVAFSTALATLRSQIHIPAMKDAKASILKDAGLYHDREDVVKHAPRVVTALKKIQSDAFVNEGQQDLLERWTGIPQAPVDLSLNNANLEAKYTQNTLAAAKELSLIDPGGKNKNSRDATPSEIYNELNQSRTAEWPIVLSWILDKMFLASIPSQYLLVDPDNLPPESVRFFHLDANWIDAFIDGALSISGQLETKFDAVRIAIKQMFNDYLDAPLPSTGQPPQIPSYGFFVRSDIINHYPDLRVTAEYFPARSASTPSILRQVNISDGVLLCLLDASPFDSEGSRLTRLKFTQAPHEQSFVVGNHLDAAELHTNYHKIYSWHDDSDPALSLCAEEITYKANEPDTGTTSDAAQIFKWGENNSIRTIQFPAWSDHLLQRLQENMVEKETKRPTFLEKTATPAVTSLQLKEPICELAIEMDVKNPAPSVPGLGQRRYLWIPSTVTSESQAVAQSHMVTENTETLARRSVVAPLKPTGIRKRLTPMDPIHQAPHYSYIRPASETLSNYVARALAPNEEKQMKPSMASSQTGASMIPVQDTVRAPASKPTYKLLLFPVGSPVTTSNGDAGTIPMVRRQDIVFSLTLSNPKLVGQFFIHEIRVMIPMGAAVDPEGNFLMENYHGPGPSMLSNLRFNVIASVTSDQKSLILRLIPRTTREHGLPFQKALEMSFLLNLVDVNVFNQETLVTISTSEFYNDDQGHPLQVFTQVHDVNLVLLLPSV